MHPIVRLAGARGTHPSQYRAIGQAALVSQLFPRPRFQGSQGMGPALTHMLEKAARSDARVHQHQHLWAHLHKQVVRPMHF